MVPIPKKEITDLEILAEIYSVKNKVVQVNMPNGSKFPHCYFRIVVMVP